MSCIFCEQHTYKMQLLFLWIMIFFRFLYPFIFIFLINSPTVAHFSASPCFSSYNSIHSAFGGRDFLPLREANSLCMMNILEWLQQQGLSIQLVEEINYNILRNVGITNVEIVGLSGVEFTLDELFSQLWGCST